MKSEKGKDILIVSLIFIASIFLWNTFLLYPVKLFVVVLHELCHGLAAILMGGGIDHILIDPRVGGYCKFYLPGNSGLFAQSFVAAAGYLGSMIMGGLIFILAARSQRDRAITFSIGVVMTILSFYVIKSGQLFGIIFCFAFAALLFASCKWLPDRFHDIFLKFLGLTSCMYAIIDIKEDLIDRSNIGSDADRIAQMFGNQSLSVPIGVAWIILAIVVLVFVMRISYKQKKQPH